MGRQVFFAERDSDKAPEINERLHGRLGRLRRVPAPHHQGWADANVRSPLVFTGDVHRNWANDLKVDYTDPASPVIGSELVCTSITSTGDGSAPRRTQ